MTRIACLLMTNDLPAHAALLQVALAHSPRVEDAGAGCLYLDASGLQSLFGDNGRLAERLRAAATAAGLAIRVGVAASRLGALAAARLGSGVAVVEPGGDAASLAAAPLSLLTLSEPLAIRLSRWGLRTLGELAALPTAGLFERAGAEGVQAQRLARGQDPRPLASWRPVPAFEETVECEWGLETLEPVVERLSELAARVCGRLGARGLAARPPRGIVEGLTLRARPTRAAPAQESLTDPSRPSPRFLAATMNRLVALVGSDRIGAPALLDSHRPDAVGLGAYVSPSPLRGEGRVRGSGNPPVLALRRLRPPAPAAVTLASGRPVAMRSSRLAGRIVAGVGPWRSSGEWWTTQPWLQDEWDVELADGTLCRLAHDGSAWHI